MRASKPKSKGSLIAALDVGSHKTACFIARVMDDGRYEVIGVGHQPSGGIKNGAIADLSKVEKTLRNAVHAAENMAADIMKGYPLREIAVSLPGVHGASLFHTIEMKISGHDITENDLRRALLDAQEQVNERLTDQDQNLVHTIMAHILLDGQQITEPVGMAGKQMSLDVHMVAADRSILRNMKEAVARSHLDISAFTLGSYASGLGCLVADEMDLGALVIDMGAGTTSLGVFENNALLYADALPIGGGHVTSDIAKGLNTSLQSAERLKILYGSAMASMTDAKELIDVPLLGADEGAPPNHVPRSMLVGIIQPRVEEIFEMLRAKLKDSGLNNALGRPVILTGGACQLSGVSDLAAHVLDQKVRIGRPINVSGLPDAVSGPAFSGGTGILHYVAERDHEIPAELQSVHANQNFFQTASRWLKENW